MILRIMVTFALFGHSFVYCHKTFYISFQTKFDGKDLPSIDEWVEFDNHSIHSAHEFTACQWVRQRYFNSPTSLNLWSHCTVNSKHSTSMECITAHLKTSAKSVWRDVMFRFNVISNNQTLTITSDINQFLHRKWVHLCFSFSNINGEHKVYYNGKLVGLHKNIATDRTVILKGLSDHVFDSSFIFGQEPGKMRGNFEAKDAFIGDLAELNVWSRMLGDVKIQLMAQCVNWDAGELVPWKKSNINVHNAKVHDLQDGSIFCKDQTRFVIFPEKVTFENAKKTCTIHGGNVAVP